MTYLRAVALLLLLVLCNPTHAESLAEISARVGVDTDKAFAGCVYLDQSRDYFARFSRDTDATPAENDTVLDGTWRIVIASDADPLVARMATDLADFLARRMALSLPLQALSPEAVATPPVHSIVLVDHGGGKPEVAESFTLRVAADQIVLQGVDARGVRDGVVQLVDRIGLRAAPFLARGEETYAPRLPVRLGPMPSGGSYRETAFLGYNAVLSGGGSLHALSRSDAIPELAARRIEGLPEANLKAAEVARTYGLKTYGFLNTRQKFPKDDPVLVAHPELRGALTWKADGEYVLCTEHPLMQRWIDESVEGMFRSDPKLDGAVIIIGGEGFYHCFMRPFEVKKGHTNCARCEALGADRVVANLCNRMAAAARRVNPKAEIVIWPYSAEHVWTDDRTQAGLIAKLDPGVALLTEIEKDEFVEKPEGVRKHLWDYSIDLIGPGERAQAQIAACQARGIPCYLKSEPESSYEAPRLPHIPSLDRWWDRAEALASCGARGAWVFPAFRGCYATSASEVAKYAWWTPHADKEDALRALAARIAGPAATDHVRLAWSKVSEAIPWVPELPAYYTGPSYLGPAQPMIADPSAAVPEVFNGYYLYMAEISDDEGVKKRPTYYTKPSGEVPVFTRSYRTMEGLLREAAEAMNTARPLVPDRCRVGFEAEDSSIQWFYRTARSEANFYESCMLRDRLLVLAAKATRSPEEIAEGAAALTRWTAVLEDERENTLAAVPIIAADVRLDAYYGGDHTFSHTTDMLQAKLEILEVELTQFLPGLAVRLK